MDYALIFQISNLIVSGGILTFLLYESYISRKITEEFDPEELVGSILQKQELSEKRADAGAKGGVARSAAIRMKEFDEIVGQSMVQGIDPNIKSIISMVYPDALDWIERNPDLAASAMKRIEPFLEGILKQQGGSGNTSGPGKRSGW